MNKIILSFLTAYAFSAQASATIRPNQVTDARSFTIALESDRNISGYLQGRKNPTPALLVEILTFVEQMDSRQIGLNPKATELLALAEEVASFIPQIDSQTRAELQPVVTSLLAQYPSRSKNAILVRLMDRYWLWSPEHLNFMAIKVRNDQSHLISTQLLWVLDHANADERNAFFESIPLRQPNVHIRWFLYALAFKYGRPVDHRDMRRLLARANPQVLRPQPLPMELDGELLATTATLFAETRALVERDSNKIDCVDLLLSGVEL